MAGLRARLRREAAVLVLFFAVLAMLAGLASAAWAGDILDDWDAVKAPARPELKPVTLAGPTTALLILDMLTSQCARPRCVASIAGIKRLHNAARAAGAMIWYSLPGDGTMPADVVDPGILPRDGEWERTGGPDKFRGSHLEEKLMARGIKTVIVCGHSFQGVGIGTGSASAERGYSVIIPIDCLSSEDTYGEQYAAWHLFKGGPNSVISKVTLTRSAMVKF